MARQRSGQPISVESLLRAIERLPTDTLYVEPGRWYRSHREHWIGWLEQYHTPGAYGRIPKARDARWVYNHVVNPYMLCWLVEASGVPSDRVALARQALERPGSYSARAGAIRRIVAWDDVMLALWPDSPTLGAGPTD